MNNKDPPLPVVLPIRPPDNRIDANEGLHPHLPPQPCVIVLYGAYKSGKSVLLANFIQSDMFFRNRMDKVVLISPTASNDDTYAHLVDDDDVDIIDSYSDDWLDEYLKFQYDTPKEERSSVMMIFDDALQYLKKTSTATLLATKFRHYLGGSQSGGYLIYVSQHFKGLPPVIRGNSGCICVMRIQNVKILKDMDEEIGGFLNGQFMKLYVYAVLNEPYSFMSINMRENPVVVYRKFEQPIYAGRWLVPEPSEVDVNNLLINPSDNMSNDNIEISASKEKPKKTKL